MLLASLAMPALLLVGAGCASFPVAMKAAGRDALNCAGRGMASSVAALTPSVLDALAGDAPEWKAQLGGIEAQGFDVLRCSVAHLLFDALGGDLGGKDLEAAAEVRLASTAKVPLPTPRRRILARGLSWLREHPSMRPTESTKPVDAPTVKATTPPPKQ
jgi:hypothetical protein